mmetsp:Transcript_9121/g.30232  ORF Transcript_9121/g.30232 Transcript_9121/m.30232 type:complete len:212 (-) Transcript_9121:538-1173(-)
MRRRRSHPLLPLVVPPGLAGTRAPAAARLSHSSGRNLLHARAVAFGSRVHPYVAARGTGRAAAHPRRVGHGCGYCRGRAERSGGRGGVWLGAAAGADAAGGVGRAGASGAEAWRAGAPGAARARLCAAARDDRRRVGCHPATQCHGSAPRYRRGQPALGARGTCAGEAPADPAARVGGPVHSGPRVARSRLRPRQGQRHAANARPTRQAAC